MLHLVFEDRNDVEPLILKQRIRAVGRSWTGLYHNFENGFVWRNYISDNGNYKFEVQLEAEQFSSYAKIFCCDFFAITVTIMTLVGFCDIIREVDKMHAAVLLTRGGGGGGSVSQNWCAETCFCNSSRTKGLAG